MRYLSSISLALIVLMALACSNTDIEATVEARLGQERAIEATVEARIKVKEAQASKPTATPWVVRVTAEPTPTPWVVRVTATPTITPTPKPNPTATRVRPTWTPIPPTRRPTPTPDVSSYYDKGRAYHEQGKIQRSQSLLLLAINEYTTAIQLNPNYRDVHYWRGSAYNFLRQYHSAIPDFDKDIQRDPTNAQNYFSRSLAYRFLGQDAKADADEAKACSLDSLYC